MNLLFASTKEDPQRWRRLLEPALPQDRLFAWPDVNGGDIDVALVATHPQGTFAQLPRLKLIQSLWMGVENILADTEVPRGVPLARLIDPGMVHAMAETVIASVLDWHRQRHVYRAQQRARLWKWQTQLLPSDRTVGLLGLGELGSYAAARLLALGFKVCGWSRRPRTIDGVHCSTDLDEILSQSQAVVCLLPLTAQTRGVLNARALARMPRGGCIINVARGAHLVMPDLIAALDSGQLAHAYLDVFETEPLPADSPLWAHPGITVTPHIAALTEPRTAVPKIVENIERVRRGEVPLNLVDFSAGY
ncbi:MAG: glyoxylate/hydroxypyruvate reductase A [Betaproteobacteria bacterium]|nr:glyoxylate/hydroxypyruvate reductase A [Betaproteobacteria bacterium]